MAYVKIRFTSKQHGATAGLIFTTLDAHCLTISGISRRFPYSEALKMQQMETSPEYKTWEEAFLHEF